MRVVHSSSVPLAEMFSSLAAAPYGEMCAPVMDGTCDAGMRGAFRASTAGAFAAWAAELGKVTTALTDCLPGLTRMACPPAPPETDGRPRTRGDRTGRVGAPA